MSTVFPDRLRAELQAMTPAERNMPAILANSGPGRFSATGATMADRDSTSATRVLTPNLDLWRMRKSPVEVRSIAVVFRTTLTCAVPAIHNAIAQARRKLDWAALNNLLDVPR